MVGCRVELLRGIHADLGSGLIDKKEVAGKFSDLVFELITGKCTCKQNKNPVQPPKCQTQKKEELESL